MPVVTLMTVNVSKRQLANLLKGNVSQNLQGLAKGAQTLKASSKPAASVAKSIAAGTTLASTNTKTVGALKLSTTASVSKTPLTVENPEQYRRAPNTKQPGRGHPFTLTDAGLQLVFKFSKQGYSNKEISAAFNGMVSPESIRRLLANVAKA